MNPLSTGGTEENNEVSSQESPSTEVVKDSIDDLKEVQNEIATTENENIVTSQVEDKEVSVSSEESNSLSNSGGENGLPASDQSSSEGLNLFIFPSSFGNCFSALNEENLLNRLGFILAL